MRANGVPNFPDPTPSGNFLLHPGPGGVNPESPALSAALAKCLKLHPVSGMLSPGTSTHPSPHALAHMLNISQCMRGHGSSWFPDPGTHIPSSVTGLVADQNGVIYAFTPWDVEQMHGSAYSRAANICGHGLLSNQLPNH